MNLKVIAFDADDTLWVCEPYFKEIEQKFCKLMGEYLPHASISRELLHAQIRNLPIYGYGIKGYTLSMIETAIKVSGNRISAEDLKIIVGFGKELIAKPVQLLEGIEKLLEQLRQDYLLVVATKGDLLDQERKLYQSGIQHLFHHTRIMSEKKESDYISLIRQLDIRPQEFMMIGNSIKSDVLPVLAIGGYAVHVPYPVTWEYEHVEEKVEHANFRYISNITEILVHLESMRSYMMNKRA